MAADLTDINHIERMQQQKEFLSGGRMSIDNEFEDDIDPATAKLASEMQNVPQLKSHLNSHEILLAAHAIRKLGEQLRAEKAATFQSSTTDARAAKAFGMFGRSHVGHQVLPGVKPSPAIKPK